MDNTEYNILGLYVKITDVDKCFWNLNQNNDTDNLWPNQWLRNKSGEKEWSKYSYQPENGHIGEIVANLNYKILNESIYIIRTFNMFYVPISISGFEKINNYKLLL
jgi:hypothetical protein